MHKNKKIYIWLSILILVCLLIVLNLDKIKFTFSMVNSYFITNDSKDDNLSNSDMEDEEVLGDNPLLEIIRNQGENNVTDENSLNNDNSSNSSKNHGENSKDDMQSDSKNKKDNYIQIISDYNNQFDSTRNNYEAKLDSLINSGYKEYKSSEISNSKLGNKYINMGSKLEKEADNNFNNLIKDMEKELKANGHSTEITKDLKSYYKNYKSSTKSKLMEKIKNHL